MKTSKRAMVRIPSSYKIYISNSELILSDGCIPTGTVTAEKLVMDADNVLLMKGYFTYGS